MTFPPALLLIKLSVASPNLTSHIFVFSFSSCGLSTAQESASLKFYLQCEKTVRPSFKAAPQLEAEMVLKERWFFVLGFIDMGM